MLQFVLEAFWSKSSSQQKQEMDRSSNIEHSNGNWFLSIFSKSMRLLRQPIKEKKTILIAKAVRHSPSLSNPRTHNCQETKTHMHARSSGSTVEWFGRATAMWQCEALCCSRWTHLSPPAILASVIPLVHLNTDSKLAPVLFSTGTAGAPPEANIAGWVESWWEAGKTQTIELLNEVILTATVEPHWPRLICPCHLLLACTPLTTHPATGLQVSPLWFVVGLKQPQVNSSKRFAILKKFCPRWSTQTGHHRKRSCTGNLWSFKEQ